MLDRCPHCRRRLPRRYEFIPPSYGTEPLVGVLLITAGYGALLFAFVHKWWPPDWWLFDLRQVDNVRLVAVSALYGLGLMLEGVLVSSLFWYTGWGARPEPAPDTPPPTETHIGGSLREVEERRWLREAGYTIPPEPERGALSRWLFAVHDGKVTFSQRGARTVIRDNAAVRQWASDVLALWCAAGWASPVSGWNGDAPDLSQGVTDVDGEVVYAIALGGDEALIERLTALVEASVDAPQRPGGVGGASSGAIVGEVVEASGRGELYELEPWEEND